ncbi:MAG: nicotinate-nucleotide adenylyltransferase [Lewinellaceae bacterium]|nr:nicotinate-nucleotide adenylyltransferase [Lewinellaceae bacterium]
MEQPPTGTKIGLFFGSFNPVHVGHLIIANYMATRTDLREVWLVVSPHNPLKAKNTLAGDYDRLHLVQEAVAENPRLRASDIEFGLPRPSYTIDTLTYLKERYPEREFVLLMGGDTLPTLPKWKNYEVLLRDYEIYVYARPGIDPGPWKDQPRVRWFDEVPLLDISATYIRACIRQGESVRYMVTEPVLAYIEQSGLYRK